ncbi:UDP-N-acetylmuramate--L-alanine ligase [bacterium]|nr:UDP-N-acetylmuramate--L-alanine ligase [bacterium]
MFKKIQHIHFIGIGGIGMSGIAEVLLTLGYKVSGSDLKPTNITKKLKKRGAKICYGHNAKNVGDVHVVVRSSAVKDNNPEVREANKRGIIVIPRAEMLAELMRLKYSLVVAGTHGKTTTTSMLAHVLAKVGLDPTVIVGGKVNAFRSNSRLGKSEFMVAEADESDRSFLKLTPTIAVITNIDPEHMESYKDFDDVRNAYVSYANKVPFYGAVIACADHKEVKKVIPRIERRVVTYGIKSDDLNWQAKNIRHMGRKMVFDLYHNNEMLSEAQVSIPGEHNVLNSLATIAAANELDVGFKGAVGALKSFKGIQRRFTQVGRSESPIIIDDYAHHPVEIKSTISAAKKGWPDRRVVVVMQPHRYSRLKSLFNDFVSCFSDADKLFITEVYPAGEKKIDGVTGEKMARAVEKLNGKSVTYIPSTGKTLGVLKGEVKEDDIILFLGAGDIWKVARDFAKLKER